MMKRKSLILLGGLALMLAGCFRQASEPFDSVEEPFTQPTTIPGNDVPVPGASATPSLVVITSTPLVPVTEAPQFTPLPLPTEPDTTGPSVNPVPLVSPSITPTFIVLTPNLPSGPVVIETATPTLPGGALTSTPSGLVTPTDLFASGDACIYIVQPGDNLFRIAVNNGTTLGELRAANPEITGDLIQPGDEIRLPNCEGAGASPATSQPATTASGQQIHVVQPGETLGAIARIYGVTVLSIVQANNLPNPDRLSIGQELIIPQATPAP